MQHKNNNETELASWFSWRLFDLYDIWFKGNIKCRNFLIKQTDHFVYKMSENSTNKLLLYIPTIQ